ncbi:rcc01693 family protein [Phaeovulum sp.]|uniref:rcc01693 family protein n=1 Tax=Phaeovulum sp. TaxID=2934796 RepID=UPI0035683DC0
MSGLDWPGLMRVGLQGLGLQPREFWRLTPAELAMMVGDAAATAPLTRARLNELAAVWPDKVKGSRDDRGGRA